MALLSSSSYLNASTSQILFPQNSSRRSSGVVRASKRDHDHDHDHRDDHMMMRSSRSVDESMIVLRKRIHEMKMIERNYEPPSDWSDWEKKYYTSYDSMICHVIGFLQARMMNTRPSLTLAMAALVLLSLPTSSALLFFHLMSVAKGLIM